MEPRAKRIFIGLPVDAPWPSRLPEGRHVPAEGRHMTLAFLGLIDWEDFRLRLMRMPALPSVLGSVGVFDACVFLPPAHPRVVSWHVQWWGTDWVRSFHQQLSAWLTQEGYRLDRRDFLPHVTVARAPFAKSHWQRSFGILPVKLDRMCIYESQPNMEYIPLQTFAVIPPFEEIPHTADRAFCIRGYDFSMLYRHALVALAFLEPALIASSAPPDVICKNIEDVVEWLNLAVAHVDEAKGCPLKAVSYAGDVKSMPAGYLQWEMICDV